MATKQQIAGQILTVTPKGLFIDGKPTTTYNGEPILSYKSRPIELTDTEITGLIKYFDAVQIMQSDTEGEYMEPGYPTPDTTGLYTWVRVRMKPNEPLSDWLRLTESTGFPVTSRDVFQTTQNQILHGLHTNILDHAQVLRSPKRPEFREALEANINKYWRTERDLMRNYVDPGNHVVSEDFSTMIIRKKLIAFAAKYPEAVNSLTPTGMQSLKLEYLVRFAEFAGLILIFPLRSSNWKSADELSDTYIKAKPAAIHEALHNLSEAMMENIQILTDKNTGEHDLYLNTRAVQDFAIRAGFDSTWKGIEVLMDKYIAAEPQAIYDALYKLSRVMPKHIKVLVNDTTGEQDVYLDINAVDAFCAKAGLETKASKAKSMRRAKKNTDTLINNEDLKNKNKNGHGGHSPR